MDNPDYIPTEQHPLLSDYALLDVALSLGGHVVAVEPEAFRQAVEAYLTRHNPEPEEPAHALAAGAPERVPLSMMQI